MDGNTAVVLLAGMYGLYLAWCRYLDSKTPKE